MLIASPRHTREDLRVWAERERMDAQFSRRCAVLLSEMSQRAITEITDFAERGPGYVGVSWGKDSVVVAHLAWCAGVELPLAWVRMPGDNPDCVLVRDTYLARWLSPYIEVEAPRGEGDDVRDAHQRGWRMLAERMGTARHVSGLRAEESTQRRMSIGALGLSTATTCRPIGYWQAEHVYAYLHLYDLPVHPAYACSMGGAIDRRHLRVAALGGERGTGHGRAEWERRYYGR